MSNTRYLRKRRGRWLVQVAVPSELRDRYGKANVEQYLGTSSEAEAKRLRHAVVAEILASFERAREGGPIRSDELKAQAEIELRRAYDAMAADFLDSHGRLPDLAREVAEDAADLISASRLRTPAGRAGPARHLHPAEFGAAAADIEHQSMRDAMVEQRRTAVDRQVRLFVVGDDFELDPGLAGDPLEEGVAVRGPPAGLGRHRAHAGDPAPVHLCGADFERLQGARHGGLGKAAAGAQALAQADDARECVDDPEPAIDSRSRDQQAAVVGTQVDGGIDRAPGCLARGQTYTAVLSGPAGS